MVRGSVKVRLKVRRIWEAHFERAAAVGAGAGEGARCRHCGLTLSTRALSNLYRHVKRRHADLLTHTVVPEQQKNGISDTDAAPPSDTRNPAEKTSNNKKKARRAMCEQCGKTVKNLTLHILKHKAEQERQIYTRYLPPESQRGRAGTGGVSRTKAPCEQDGTSARVSATGVACKRERIYACDRCPASFVAHSTLYHHVRSVHERVAQYMCHYCSKTFYKKCHLIIHIRVHTGERPYACSECGLRFKCGSALRQHAARHGAPASRAHACRACPAAFHTHRALRRHQATHLAARRHVCGVCGAAFRRTDHRNRHLARHRLPHPALPTPTPTATATAR